MMAPSPDRQRNSLGVFGFHNFQPVHDMYNNIYPVGILYSYMYMYTYVCLVYLCAHMHECTYVCYIHYYICICVYIKNESTYGTVYRYL